jgi:hypothetical protein
MLQLWTKVAILNLEASRVIWLRSLLLAKGGTRAQHEMGRMVTEKVAAASQAYAGMMLGRSAEKVVGDYRGVVRRNARRLSR